MIKRDIGLNEGAENKAYFIDPSKGLCIAQGDPKFLTQVYNDYKAKQAEEHGFLHSPTLLLIQDEFNHDIGFTFHPSDIETIHRHKDGQGWGFWYRLKDGRVFNSMGKETDNTPAIYASGREKNTDPL